MHESQRKHKNAKNGILVLLLASAMILALASCQKNDTSSDGDRSAAVPATGQQPAANAEEPPVAAEEPAAAPDTLAQRILDFKASREQPPEVKQTMQEETTKLREQGISANAVQAGQQAPNFDLISDSGEEYHLSDMLAKGPVVLIFFRGSW